MRAALYARFSTDDQSESSVEDQFRICERLATREILTIVARFEDRAISGGTHERPGYQAMLAGARRGDFEVILVEDLSRLWRNRAEFGSRSAELEDLRVHMVTAVGDDTRRDGWGLTIQIKLAVAEHQRRETGYRTKRGLEGLALAGRSAGGKAYGYVSQTESPTGARAIDPATAPIVREIFARFVDGDTLRGIASALNVRGIPSPGATWNREQRASDGLWRVSAIHSLLHNELYIGRLIWNRSRWIRSAVNSKKRRYVENPPEEWIVHEREELRLIDEETWHSAQQRLNERAELYGAGRGGLPKFILSGLLKCGICGRAFTINAHKPVRYSCSNRHTAGIQACSNSLMVSREVAEREILATVRERFLLPEARALAVEAIREACREEPRGPPTEIARLDHQIRELERLRREGVLSPEVAAAGLRQAHRDREAATRPGGMDATEPGFAEEAEYVAAIDQLAAVLEGEEAVVAREALREVIDTIQLHPREGVLWAELKTGARLRLVNQLGSGGAIWIRLAA